MANKIDRLFQDKLVRHELNPTPEAWNQVVKKLDKKNKPTYWLSIAASVAVLAVSAFLLLRSNEEPPIDSVTLAPMDQPSQPSVLADFHWGLPAIREAVAVKAEPKEEKVESVIINKNRFTNTVLVDNSVKTMEDVRLIEDVPIIETPNFIEVVAVVEEPSQLNEGQVSVLPQLRVQITYMASETVPDVEDEKTKFGKLLAKARQIKPGDMLASIRDTKNDFFSGKRN